MKDFIESVIATGNYVLSEMEERIQKMYVLGKLTTEELEELLSLAANNARDSMQIDVTAKLKELEDRIYALEHPVTPDFPVWVAGYVTKKGETVQYDYDGDGVMDLLRYDGGRAETALRPGKIDGWHVVDSVGTILGTFYGGEFTPLQ
jgi:hypothetical protein